MAERIDDLQCRGYRIIQDTEAFCFGMDAVLLANFAAPSVSGETPVLDFCTGNGIIPLLLAAKTEAPVIHGLEIQPAAVQLARRSAALNHAEDRIRIVEGDLRDFRALFPEACVKVVTANPPYLRTGLRNADSRKKIARHEILMTFPELAKAAAYVLKTRGSLFLVHRPSRLPEILETLRKEHLEPKRLRMVYPYQDREANLFLLEAVKGGGIELRVEPPLIVYEAEQKYTNEIFEIYGK